MSKQYITNLTALRGIAALITVIYHVDVWIGNGGGMLVPTAVSRMPERLYLMVDFFFVLSGFIMYHVYGRSFAQGVQKSEFWAFLKARFARVYPLHVLSLCLMAGLLYMAHKLGIPYLVALEAENSAWSFVTNLLLVHSMNLHGWFTWVHASWSISTEWWMYMVFPFLVVPFERMNGTMRWGVFAGCYALYAAIMYFFVTLVHINPEVPIPAATVQDMSINVSFQHGFVRCFAGFLIGMVIYRAYLDGLGRSLWANGVVMTALTILLFLLMHLLAPDALTVATFPLLILGAAYGSAGINRILQSKPLQRLGDWSFSIYLMHQPLILLFFTLSLTLKPPTDPAQMAAKPDPVTGWVICAIVIALTLVVSALVYRFWERPARRWINGRSQ
jgi:peptidoglycan/LPS O-acetylase OafA/YrhL